MQISTNILRHFSIAAFFAAMLFSPDIQAQDTIPAIQKDSILRLQDSASLKKNDTVLLSKRALRKLNAQKARDLRDSLRKLKPLILNTYVLPDSLKYKRMITWNQDSYLNKMTMINPDTTYNENFHDLPIYKKDVGATYLGIAGSPSLFHNYFLREENPLFKPASLYTMYSYTPDNLPFYNVKSPVTELQYDGTLLASRQTEESNVRFMHSQNYSPSLNFNILYKRYGAKGLLTNEATDNRTFALSMNFLGEKYLMHAGYIYQGVKRQENGGVVDDGVILDTIIDPRTLTVLFDDADNVYKRNTFFINQSYGIRLIKSKDTTQKGKGTIAYLGHSGEYTTYRRVYTDVISSSNIDALEFYDNTFNITSGSSYDSTRVSSFENKFYLRLQPWANEAIISKIDGGVGYQMISVFSNKPEFDSLPPVNNNYSNLYVYTGASGKFRKYFSWEGFGKLNLAGYFASDFLLEGKIRLSFYPIKDGIHLSAKLKITSDTPNWYDNYTYSNHYSWENNFAKITSSRLEGNLEIPAFKMSAYAGYEIVANKIYYDTKGVIQQSSETLNIISGYLQKDFKIGILHLNNRILAQVSSNDSIMPLPTVSANLRYFLEFDLVKSVLRGQFGADVTYNTKYYAPAYNPALSVFQLQKIREIGNTPYIDLFANLQWKRASIFVKYENALQGWPSADYFSALHYIKPQTAIKFGIHWPFYVK